MHKPQVILLVDDDPDDRDFFCEALRKSGHTNHVLHAENGADAIAKLEKLQKSGNLPCLIILDINMPIMDGRTALHKIREEMNLTETPIAIFTTTKPFDGENLIHRYAIDIIEKPVSISGIITEINRLLVKCL